MVIRWGLPGYREKEYGVGGLRRTVLVLQEFFRNLFCAYVFKKNLIVLCPIHEAVR